MKFFVVLALCVAAASASLIAPVVADEAAEIQMILEAINHPSTDPATAAALQEMLLDIIGHPPISVGPAIVDGEYESIAVGPAIVPGEFESISVGPAIVEEIAPAPVVPSPVSSPLVQIIVNVKPGLAGNPVVVEGIETSPVIVGPSPVPEPTPVIVVPEAVFPVVPEPVIVAPGIVFPVIPEPVVVAPIVPPAPVVVLPDILN